MADHITKTVVKPKGNKKPIMFTIGGNMANRRWVQMMSVYSIFLDGAWIWNVVLGIKKYKVMLMFKKRKFRICSANNDVMVSADILPLIISGYIWGRSPKQS